MKSFIKNFALTKWLTLFALAFFALGGFSRDAQAGDRHHNHHSRDDSWNRHDWGRFAERVVIRAAIPAPPVVYATPYYGSPCPGARSCYDYGGYGAYSPSPYAAGWSRIIQPTVVQPLPVYPGAVIVQVQPGEVERQEADAASRQADQARQLIDLATRAGDRSQIERGIAMLREASSSATAAATVAREVAFHEARGPFAQAATSNAQQAQAAADRISQTLRQYQPR